MPSKEARFPAPTALAYLSALVLWFTVGTLAWSRQPTDPGSYLATKAFARQELYLSTTNVPLPQVVDRLPNRAAWQRFHFVTKAAAPGGEIHAFIDRRSGTTASLIGSFPLLPNRGRGLTRGFEGSAKVLTAVRRFIREHQDVLGIDFRQLGMGHAAQVTPDLWQVTIPQVHEGIPVRYGRLAATIKYGNLVLIGTETWGNVEGPALKTATLPAEEALRSGFDHAGGRSVLDRILRPPALEILPVAVDESGVGRGYGHVLVWSFTFAREGEPEVWGVTVDAGTGEVLAFEDGNRYIDARVVGGVYPARGVAGMMEQDWPMPFADVGVCTGSPNFTDSGGIFTFPGGPVATRLRGKFVAIRDRCPGTFLNSFPGCIRLLGMNGDTNCDSGGGSGDNTAAARTAFYEINRIAEMARGWLPGNPWLQSTVRVVVNRNAGPCTSTWGGSTGTFSRSSAACRNPGEITSILDHEWGHGLDENDANLLLSNPSEGYADIAALYRLQDSCIGDGFRTNSTTPSSCGMDSTGDTFANEAPAGKLHCDVACTGFRDADWSLHNPPGPDTPANFVCPVCAVGSGPCGRQVHCAAAPIRQAAWDLVTIDLPALGLNSETAFILGNKLFYQGSGNIGLWYACDCGKSSSNGCGVGAGYLQWLAADDDDGNLNNGTPHMAAIFNAFDRHGIACPNPTPQNSGCESGPATPPFLSATAGPGTQVSLSWGPPVVGASRYWVFRTDGGGCDFGKALIAEVPAPITTFVDHEVGAAREYHYNVVAVGASSVCFSPASPCESVITPPLLFPSACQGVGDPCFLDSDCCGVLTGGCSKGKPCSRTCLPP